MADKLNVPNPSLRRAVAVTAIALSMAHYPATVSASASPEPAKQCPGGIFTDTPRQGIVEPGSSRTVRRVRRVEVDFGRVFPKGAPSAAHTSPSLVLNLFPDVCVTAAREQATDLGPLNVRWVGKVESDGNGKAILVVDDELMVGTVTVDRRTFQIRYLGDGVHAIADVDSSSFPRD